MCWFIFQRLCFLSFELSGPLQIFRFTVYWEIVSVPRTNTSTWGKSLSYSSKWKVKILIYVTFYVKVCENQVNWRTSEIHGELHSFFVFYYFYALSCAGKSEFTWQGKPGDFWLLSKWQLAMFPILWKIVIKKNMES